jgi:hypothetical protein
MHWQPAGQPHAKTALVHLNASEGLFDGRGQRVVISVEDEDSEQLCRLCLARVAADRMDRPIDARLAVIHLRLDRARDHIGVDESRLRVGVGRRGRAGRPFPISLASRDGSRFAIMGVDGAGSFVARLLLITDTERASLAG